MLLAHTFYDRYLLPLLPYAILFLIQNLGPDIKSVSVKLHTFLVSGISVFVLFLGAFSYQLGMDFVLNNKYVLNKSAELVREYSISPTQITSSYAWNFYFVSKYICSTREMKTCSDLWYPQIQNIGNDYFLFTYDSPEVRPELLESFSLLETYKPEFPGSIWINPSIYLYKKASIDI